MSNSDTNLLVLGTSVCFEAVTHAKPSVHKKECHFFGQEGKDKMIVSIRGMSIFFRRTNKANEHIFYGQLHSGKREKKKERFLSTL